MIEYERQPIIPRMRNISWSGILAGVTVALALQVMLAVLGIGLGANALHPSNAASAGSLGFGSAIWLFVTTILALFAGGWVAGRLAGVARPFDSALHGVVAWALMTILTLYLLTTTIGGLFSGAGAVLGNVAGVAGQGIAAASPGLAKAVSGQVGSTVQQGLAQPLTRHVLAEAAGTAKAVALDPNASGRQFNDLLYKMRHDTGTASSAADRRTLIGLVAAKEHISREKATVQVDAYRNDATTIGARAKTAAQGVLDDAKTVGDRAASGLATTSILTFFFLLLGSLAAGIGGFLATPRALARLTR